MKESGLFQKDKKRREQANNSSILLLLLFVIFSSFSSYFPTFYFFFFQLLSVFCEGPPDKLVQTLMLTLIERKMVSGLRKYFLAGKLVQSSEIREKRKTERLFPGLQSRLTS